MTKAEDEIRRMYNNLLEEQIVYNHKIEGVKSAIVKYLDNKNK